MRCSLDISGITSSSPVASSVKPCSFLASSSRLKKYLHRIIHPLKLLLNQQWEAFSGTSRVPASGSLHLIFILCYFISISVPAVVEIFLSIPRFIYSLIHLFGHCFCCVAGVIHCIVLGNHRNWRFHSNFPGSFSSVLFTVSTGFYRALSLNRGFTAGFCAVLG